MTTQNSILSFYSHISLNAQQEQATQQLESFFAQTEDQIFVLKGYAGTGKTTLLKGVLEFLEDLHCNFIAMAPTGRASRILGLKTGQLTGTVHSSIFYVKVNDDGDLLFRLRETPPNGTILLIDEASMLKAHPMFLQNSMKREDIIALTVSAFDQTVPTRFNMGEFLLNDLLTFADLKANPDTKIIFVGDDAQLPPVGLSTALVFNSDLMKSLGFGYEHSVLTKVERTDNGILTAATHIREQIVSGKLNSTKPIQSSDVKMVNHQQLISCFLQENPTLDHCNDSILVLSSNQKVNAANSTIRGNYFGWSKTPSVQLNEKLMVYANHYGNNNNFHFNGDNLTVLEVLNEIHENISVKLSNSEKEQITRSRAAFESKLPGYISLTGDQAKVEVAIIKLRVKDADDNEESIYISRDFLYAEESDTHRIYRRAIAALANMAEKKYVQECESKQRPIDNERSEELRSPFSECLYVKFAYAITCHKAQGGEWKKVYANICTAPDRARTLQHFKWVYTAYTRASVKLTVGAPMMQQQFTPRPFIPKIPQTL
jgi:hypothetical protein